MLRGRYISLVLIATLVGVPLMLSAQSAEELQNEINEHQAQIEALDKEIAAFEKELEQIGTERQTLQSAVNALDVSVRRTQAQVKAKQNQIATTELEIQQLSGDILTKEESIALDSAAVAESIRSLYETESDSLVEMILAHNSIADVWNDAETLRAFQDNVRAHVRSLETAKEELTEDRDQTEKKREQLVQQRRDLASQEESLTIQKKEQQNLLSQTKSKESNYQTLLEDKKAAKAAFEEALNELESKLEYTRDPSRLPPAGKGILRWPLDKVTITQQFGKTSDSGRLYSSGTHNGVDFRASIGTPIKVSLSGTVQGTGNTDAIRGCYSYGKWVLVRHSNGLTTLYAHLSQINVSEGQEVSTGQVIGYSGFTGYATGPHLHFTVYASDAVQIRKLNSGKGCNDAVIPVSAASGYLNPLDYL